MNFLAHFDLTTVTDSPEYQLGGLLPDLAKRAGFQLTPGKIKPVHENLFPELIRGIRLHWKADKHFHQSPLFEVGNRLWKSALTEIGCPPIERKFFLYHLLFEMWLDRLLIKQNQSMPARMYEGIDAIDPKHLSVFSSMVLEDTEDALYIVYLDFMKRRFIAEYADSNAFAHIATGIFGHITGQYDSKKLVPSILKALEHLENEEMRILSMWTDFKLDLIGQ